MSDLILNLDTTIHQCTKKGSETNKKHQRFVKRRRFLERKGFLKQKQLPAQPSMPKRDALHRREGMDWERNKKRQKIDRQDGHIGWDRPGRDCNPLQEEGLTRRPKVFPKENSSHSAKESGNPSGLSSAPSKIGSSFVRHNRAQANSSVGNIRTASLFSEYDSGLPMLAALNLPSRMVAMDCEMVGTGPGGRNSDLARCSIVSYYGDVIYDKYIRPVNPITNYRTRWSGIRRHHMTNAVPFREAQKEVRVHLAEAHGNGGETRLSAFRHFVFSSIFLVNKNTQSCLVLVLSQISMYVCVCV